MPSQTNKPDPTQSVQSGGNRAPQSGSKSYKVFASPSPSSSPSPSPAATARASRLKIKLMNKQKPKSKENVISFLLGFGNGTATHRLLVPAWLWPHGSGSGSGSSSVALKCCTNNAAKLNESRKRAGWVVAVEESVRVEELGTLAGQST